MSHPNCHKDSCVRDCCNLYGYCPEDYSSLLFSSSYTQCYYYYQTNTPVNRYVNFGLIAGAISGGLAFLTGLIVFIVYMVRKNRNAREL